jgi:outer membrane murein-binding lipoprotein Lpp
VTGGLEHGRTREAAEVLAERDAIQANLLELDGSFVKRMLDGAALTGQTRQRWATGAATLASLWETYLAYSAVVDRIAALGAGGHRSSRREQPELTQLLSGGCVQLPDAAGSAGPARRDLASRGRPPVTLATAVAAMRRSFAEVTDVTSAVEAGWAALGPPLDAAEAELAARRPLAAGLGPEAELAFRDADAALAALRSDSNADPLAFLRDGGRVDTAAADRLAAQVTSLGGKVAELDRLRSRARSRIDALAAAAGAARADRRDAIVAVTRAAELVTLALPVGFSSGGADVGDVAEPRLAGLSALAGGGHWDRLQAELDRGEAELAAAAGQTAEIRRMAAAALARREELRGLLGAYKAKAARLGASEDVAISGRYDQAHDLLWSAPCDLGAAEAAVSGYQQAILATERRR